jgi:hypothetical protein
MTGGAYVMRTTMEPGYDPPSMSLTPPVDEILRLVGDEDCGVGVNCMQCDTGGRPVIWYDGYSVENPYDEAEVPTAHTIRELVALGDKHVRDVHAAG